MTVLWIVGAGLLLFGSMLLEEAAAWYGRNALDRREDEDDPAEAQRWARDARGARLLARLLAGAGFGAALAALGSSPSAIGTAVLVAAAGAWAMLETAVASTHWRSPLSLAGRALFRPLRPIAGGLRAAVLLWCRLPGWGTPSGALGSLEELEHELRWVQGRSGEDEEGRMLATLHEFGESMVEDLMVPREEVVGIPAETTVAGALGIVAIQGYSRYPVYRESLDTVTGVLHVFDLLGSTPDARAASLAREPLFTNATKSVGSLLRELQVTYNQMAVVVDEYGGIAGVVTVEDLLEELVGEIRDELDREEMERRPLRRLEPDVYWVSGSMRIEDLNEELGLDLEEGEYDTVAGLVLERLERIPRPGERLREDGVWLEVVAAEPQRINALKLALIEKDRGEGQEET